VGKVIVAEFVTLDGVVEDPDGSGGLPEGGWAFHAGPEVFAGDKFGLGPIMATGALLLGRVTWELFASRWPSRSGGFADAMNAMAKVVVSHRQLDLDTWSNSSTLDGDLAEGVKRLATDRDVAIAGSTSVVHQLAAADLVDEYRLITVPVALGTGRQLFAAPAALRLASVAPADTTLLARYERAPRPAEEG
jgi:dihydrofolate reductase